VDRMRARDVCRSISDAHVLCGLFENHSANRNRSIVQPRGGIFAEDRETSENKPIRSRRSRGVDRARPRRRPAVSADSRHDEK